MNGSFQLLANEGAWIAKTYRPLAPLHTPCHDVTAGEPTEGGSMEDPATGIARIVRADDELQATLEADAKATARGLIQGYLCPDHKVLNMQKFYSALLQA